MLYAGKKSKKCFILLLLSFFILVITVSCSKPNNETADNPSIINNTTKSKETDMITNNNNTNELVDEPPVEVEKISLDENGFDLEGRMVAYFGSPVIGEELDEIWSKAQAINPQHASNNLDTTATFKALWDDRALYFLIEVIDNDLSVQSDTPYMQDSVEIFLDENNDKTYEYGIDDLHFRVNYKNSKSVDNGDPERFYTKTRESENGYIVEARIALNSKHFNNDVLGIELQINEAKATNRVGTINVFDSTGSAWNDTSKFGEILLTGKTPDAKRGLNPYDLLVLIEKVKDLDLHRYKNPETLTNTIEIAENLLKEANITQEQIDEQSLSIKDTIDNLVLTDEASREKEFVPIPDEYKGEHINSGSIEGLEYPVANSSGGIDIKELNVYLPYGYDDSDKNTKYNVLYLMHGGGENENLIFGGPGESKELKRVLDNMIANKDIEPLIVVTPTFYGGKNDTALFHEELINDILPLIETTYNTYAKSTDLDDMNSSRDHRAFGGFSMGSVTTWYAYINCLDYFKYFIPLSGDCWAIAQTAGESRALETAQYLAEVAKEGGYNPQDYYIFCATGSLDIAYPNMVPQIEAMKQLDDSFIYSADLSRGNFYFLVCDTGTHAWNWVNHYIYDILPDLFQK